MSADWGLVRRSVLALSGSGAEEVVGGYPERVRVRQVRVGRRHPVDELGRGGAAFQRCLEIGEVAAAFADLAAGVVGGGPGVAVAPAGGGPLPFRPRLPPPPPTAP